jgi:N-glycosidase YbiA
VNFPTEIRSFSREGGWPFLSNFYPCTVMLDDVAYPSVEHAYQAAKTLNLKEREKFLYAGVKASDAKRMGDTINKSGKRRIDWEQVNTSIMKDLLMQKFYPTVLRRKLISTFTAELIEGNWWHDTFWGVCEGTCKQGPHEPFGENILGKLLMEVRAYYSTYSSHASD